MGFICEEEAENLKQDNWEKSDESHILFHFLCCLCVLEARALSEHQSGISGNYLTDSVLYLTLMW